jgi:hypothetical protein
MVGLIALQLFKLFTCFLSGGNREKYARNMKVRGSGWCSKQYPVLKLVYSEQIHWTGYLSVFRVLYEKLGFTVVMAECLCARTPPPPRCYISEQLTSFLLTSSEHDSTRHHHTLVRFDSLLRWPSCESMTWEPGQTLLVLDLKILGDIKSAKITSIKLLFMWHFAECQWKNEIVSTPKPTGLFSFSLSSH